MNTDYPIKPLSVDEIIALFGSLRNAFANTELRQNLLNLFKHNPGLIKSNQVGLRPIKGVPKQFREAVRKELDEARMVAIVQSGASEFVRLGTISKACNSIGVTSKLFKKTLELDGLSKLQIAEKLQAKAAH